MHRHLLSNGILIFFDVQPIAVKAYAGCRYTVEKELALESKQKTRGLFYLFLIYEVSSAIVHWAFFANKNSKSVCRFMRQVRRWYAKKKVWIALDQDRSHPRKSRLTRRTMRELKLRWISLPKGSPNDNPVETIFSDVKLMILDNSNDPDMKTTQRCISSHLRHRNYRSDRRIHRSYLLGFHKN
ncbi:MAG: transposase [Acidobacteriota bacterium]